MMMKLMDEVLLIHIKPWSHKFMLKKSNTLVNQEFKMLCTKYENVYKLSVHFAFMNDYEKIGDRGSQAENKLVGKKKYH